MKSSIIILLLIASFGIKNTLQAQLINKLKNKANKAINKLEKGDLQSHGEATVSMSGYESVSIKGLSSAKITDKGQTVDISGAWRSHDADIFDGYSLTVNKPIDDIQGTHKLGDEVSMKIGFDPEMSTKGLGKAVSDNYQNLNFYSGTVTITQADENAFIMSFDAKSEGVLISGNISANQVEIFDHSQYYSSTSEDSDDEYESDDDYDADAMSSMFGKSGDETKSNIKDSYSFNGKITHEMTVSGSNEKSRMSFLMSNQEGVYAISVNMRDHGSNGNSVIVMDNGESHIFVNAEGTKMRMSQMPMGNQAMMPDQTFDNPNNTELKKTGNVKTILGYKCHEYIVKDDQTNAHFWVAPDLSASNWMQFPDNDIQGHILEYDIVSEDGSMKSIAVDIDTNANVKIVTSEYPKMF